MPKANPETYKDVPLLFFASANEWEVWLDGHYELTTGVWLKFAKKSSGITSLGHEPALEVALCYGWIDGQAQTLDETYYLQKFTPRRPRSLWSQRNIGIVTRLIAEGRMRPAGQAAIDAAKADGRWDRAYSSPSTMGVLADLQAALDASPKAKAFYETLNKSNTYAIAWRLETAAKPETRAARLQKLITMLEKGEKPY